jgi:aquaporin Z
MYVFKKELTLYLSEATGTALLLFFGLSIVIFIWGEGSPVPALIPNVYLLRALTGFLFGSVGCLVTISPVGKISGAHINPAVSLAFWLRGKMHTGTLFGYIFAQMAGAAAGSVPLLLWGERGRTIQFAMTLPAEGPLLRPFAGEALSTAVLILYLSIFIGHRRLRNFTPFGIPLLYCLLNTWEAPLSGCSTNPARSFGPALIAGNFNHYWLYWAAPVTGVVLISGLFRWPWLRRMYKLEAARLSYHGRHSPLSLQTGMLAPKNP